MAGNFKSFKESQKTTLWLSYLAMFSSICIFFALVEMGLINNKEEQTIPFPIHYLGLIPAVISLWIHYRLKTPLSLARATLEQSRKAPEKKPDYSDIENHMRFFFPQYLNRMVFSLALNESVTILALVGHLSGATSLNAFYANFGISLVLMILMRPSIDDMFKEVEKLISRELY